ncbi:D-isomer specific 2-hydroxyacid dehydrogenase [Alcanivorax sp. S71-1-4]|nr:D-isomer specific 2-hydroxyacid dehydrogenase [Alcanivorax sp. S71-1-4]
MAGWPARELRMFHIQTLNQIAVCGLERFPRERYEVASEFSQPDAILLRSHPLGAEALHPGLKAVARAGAGVNNITVPDFTAAGVPVFNTPGANANAVKELVLAALLLGSRGILPGIDWVRSLTTLDERAMHATIEAEKKRFRGQELTGRTLGVVGLGAIGSRVADMALGLGMQVIGFDPALSVDAAWRLPHQVRRMESLPALMARADYVTLHLPLLESTRHLLGREAFSQARPGLRLLNFARDGIVDDGAAVEALRDGRLSAYLTDFPSQALIREPGVVALPHLGASTGESEENCARMASDQLIEFLEHGNIVNAVNFPTLVLERSGGHRLAVSNRNVPKMLGQLLSVLADANLNVLDMLNRSRDDIAYNLLDLETAPDAAVLARLASIEGVVGVRLLPPA